jgi:tripartite-type tricarboxylate transporter receptor subunit TctC
MKKTLLLLAACFALSAKGQEPPFPQRSPVEITVLFPAGTSADVTARMLADGMAKHLGQRVLVVNRPGAGGAIGYKYVRAQKPDGYALVWNSNSISTTYHSGQLEFDYQAFDAVARVLVESVVVAVRADARWKSLNDLIAEAKAKPKAISVGHSGIGSHTHISLAALFSATGAQVNEVPFGAAQVVPSLLGGHVDAVVQLPAALSAPVKQGQVRLIAALIPNRDPALPDVPTAREQGVDVSLEAWRGIAAPRGTPRAAIAALENAIRRTVESAEFQKGSENLGVRPAFLPAAEFSGLISKEDASLSRLMQLIGLKKTP